MKTLIILAIIFGMVGVVSCDNTQPHAADNFTAVPCDPSLPVPKFTHNGRVVKCNANNGYYEWYGGHEKEETAIWMVTWEVINRHFVKCETKDTECDEYGICDGRDVSVSIACVDSITKKISKEFAVEQEAWDFIEQLRSKKCDASIAFPGGCVQNIVLKRVVIEAQR